MSTPESSQPADGATPGSDPAQLLEAGPAAALGRFRYDTLTDTWWWSEQMFEIHGLSEGDTELTTDRILSFKHPDDRAEAAATMQRAMESGRPFTQPHRVLTPDASVRQVITLGEGIVLGGRVVAVHGYMVDVTGSVERQVHDDAWQEASRVIEQRAVIERAKGALMVRYGVDADAAFELLRSWSSTRNEKLRDVATQVVENL